MNNEIRNCYFSSDENCCSHSREILVNLKDRYDLCTVEKQIEGFKADILLENSNNLIYMVNGKNQNTRNVC